MTHTYYISGVTCGGCQKKVESLLSKVEGVEKINIDLAKGTADIGMSRHIPTAELKLALKDYQKYQLSPAIESPQVLSANNDDESKSWFATYKPILIIFAYILIISVIAGLAGGAFNIPTAMRVFMAGFFLIFSFFKMLDLNAFADSYAMYDIVARKVRAWGFIYAFTELFLGIAYSANLFPGVINFVTVAVMSVSILGVLQSVLNKRKMRCACLGAVFNLPMSTVTIIEDALMIAMGVIMQIMLG
ncbi:heavy-metal-associated domain-containing protein [Mucilaginibacter sp. L3T2-6]|uniref:heavy-metal-associated domain-containing protein n=1 Tax=Mucilaginibacter sp. L3T2-6 TaxID=3062491 RepID=UPI0026756CEB|nr:cation transporter [Mucilaginibacter sp. L3T2-6]MDO3641470.1 cation transporter [Mucilaginibacter sp. L3T2-6]MDV6213769.1 cation transporter [Mucilaginibacter sp. L3T2-6]